MFCKFEKVEVNIDKLEKMKVNSKKPFNVLRKKMWTLTNWRKWKWTVKTPFNVLRKKMWTLKDSRKWKWTVKKPFDVLRKKMWTLTDSRKWKWTEKGEPFMFCKFEKVDINIDKLEKLFVNKWIDEPFDVLQTCRAQSPLLQQFQVLHWGQISIQTFFCQELYFKWERKKIISLIYNFACIHLNLNNSP